MRTAGGKVDWDKFLAWLKEAGLPLDEKGVPNLEQLTPKLFAKAISLLNDRRRNAQKKAKASETPKNSPLPAGDAHEGPMP